MRVRSSSGLVRGLGGALLLSSVLSGDPVVGAVHADAARAGRSTQVRGEHAVRAELGPRSVELLLKDGFSLRARGRTGVPPASVTLRVAAQRAAAHAIAEQFIPIGPSVAVEGQGVRADVAYRAEAFHVRRGHRLVLALEQPGCQADAACWLLVPAAYADSRCVARGVDLPGGRLQFGSLPISAAQPVGERSAAP